MNRFVISISNNEIDENAQNKDKDNILFYHIDINNDINFEKIISLSKLEKSENNLFEIFNYNLIICKLESSIESVIIVNSVNYMIEKIIKLTKYDDICKNYNFFTSSFFMTYKSIHFKGDYYLSTNKNLDLIQWDFDYKNNTFIPVNNLSLNFIKKDDRFQKNKELIIQKVLFFQENNEFIALTNDNLIICIILEE